MAILYDCLAVGIHIYEIALHARFPGSYTYKGAHVELQYALHVEAKGSTSRVVIKHCVGISSYACEVLTL